MTLRLKFAAAFVLLFLAAGSARAGAFEQVLRRAVASFVEVLDVAPFNVSLRPVATSLAAPVEVVNAGDGSGRLFIVELGGTIRILRKSGELLPAPFLDISPLVLTGDERGMLGLAFHPQYATNRKFYVYYTRQPDGAVQLFEYLASAANPDGADATSARPLLSIAHPLGNHNGGRIAFGPDGYLYVGIGDGGGGGDPDGNGQNTAVLLGKILRLDVNTPTGYLIPPTNPFVGKPGADEVWAYGLRNPWKFSFDRAGGGLYIADVGQNAWEEVNFEMPGSPGGLNYGWGTMEGTHCFNPPSGCQTAGLVPPIIEHGHDAGWVAIIGGYVYRGSKISAMRGYYLYGDLGLTALRVIPACCGDLRSHFLIEGPGGHSSFGEDEDGELYLASLNTGTVYAIDAAAPLAAPVNPAPAAFMAKAATAFPYRYAGNMSGGMDSATFRGLLAQGDTVRTVVVGETIDGMWRVTAITREHIEVRSLTTDADLSVPLSESHDPAYTPAP